MSNRFDHDVFLSHSPHDEQVARALAERLKADGLRVWLAAWEIEPWTLSAQKKVQQGLELDSERTRARHRWGEKIR